MRTLFGSLLLLLFAASVEADEVLGAGVYVGWNPQSPLYQNVLVSTSAGRLRYVPGLHVMVPAGRGRIYGLFWRDILGTGPIKSAVGVITRAGIYELAPLPPQWHGTALAVARDGTIFVLAETSRTTNDSILVLSPEGALLRRWELDWPHYGAHDGWTHIELAADQCTLLLHGRDYQLRRFNACSGEFGATFPPPIGGRFFLLADGRLVDAASNYVRIYDASGALLRDYPIPMPFNAAAATLADGGESVLLIQDAWEERDPDRNVVRKVNLATGAITTAGVLEVHEPGSIVAVPAWTAALGTSASVDAAEVPLTTPAALLLLAGLLAVIGVKYAVIA